MAKIHKALSNIREVPTGYVVTIPKHIGDMLHLTRADRMEWVVEESEDTVTASVSFVFDEHEDSNESK